MFPPGTLGKYPLLALLHSSLISVFWTSKVWRKCKLCQYKDSVPLGLALQLLSLFELFIAWAFVVLLGILLLGILLLGIFLLAGQ